MQYSPKLKKAMDEIKAIMKKYDCGGVAVIHTPGFSEYFLRIDPPYSCAKIENDHLKINLNLQHYSGSSAIRDKFASDTSNFLMHMAEVVGRCAMNFMQASETLDKQIKAEHFGNGHSSQSQQNN